MLQKALNNSEGKDKYRIKYVVICPEKNCKVASKQREIEIDYYPIESMEWIGYIDHPAYFNYQKLSKIIEMRKKNDQSS